MVLIVEVLSYEEPLGLEVDFIESHHSGIANLLVTSLKNLKNVFVTDSSPTNVPIILKGIFTVIDRCHIIVRSSFLPFKIVILRI